VFVCLSVCPIGILTVCDSSGAACDAASVHFGPSTNILVVTNVVVVICSHLVAVRGSRQLQRLALLYSVVKMFPQLIEMTNFSATYSLASTIDNLILMFVVHEDKVQYRW